MFARSCKRGIILKLKLKTELSAWCRHIVRSSACLRSSFRWHSLRLPTKEWPDWVDLPRTQALNVLNLSERGKRRNCVIQLLMWKESRTFKVKPLWGTRWPPRGFASRRTFCRETDARNSRWSFAAGLGATSGTPYTPRPAWTARITTTQPINQLLNSWFLNRHK